MWKFFGVLRSYLREHVQLSIPIVMNIYGIRQWKYTDNYLKFQIQFTLRVAKICWQSLNGRTDIHSDKTGLPSSRPQISNLWKNKV